MATAKKPSKVTSFDFVGRWELVPGESKYDLQQPPKAATLELKEEQGGMFIRLEWTDHVGAKGELDHSFRFKKPVMVNGVDHTLVLNDDGSLETVSEKDGAEVSRTVRTLSPDGKRMELVQSGKAGAKTYKNLSVYQRVAR